MQVRAARGPGHQLLSSVTFWFLARNNFPNKSAREGGSWSFVVRGGMSAIVNLLSTILGKRLALLFGKECLRSSTWMCISLFIRYLVSMFYLENYIPVGMIFSFPYIIQLVCLYVPWMESKTLCNIPLLPIRLAESILGRVTPIKLTVVIPAHFLGCILGAVMFRTFFPYVSLSVSNLNKHPLPFSY